MKPIEIYEDSIFKQYFPAIAMFGFLIFMILYELINIGSPKYYDIKESFSGIVTSKYVSKSWIYVELNNKEEKQEIKNGFNYEYATPELINFVEIGDIISKNECSDTVYIKRGNDEYHFIQLAYWYNDKSRTIEFKQKYMGRD